MSKYAKVKAWANRNQHIIVLIGGSSIVIGLLVVGIKSDIAFKERMTSELNDYVDQLNAVCPVDDL